MTERILCPKCKGEGYYTKRTYGGIGSSEKCPLCKGAMVVIREVTYIALEETKVEAVIAPPILDTDMPGLHFDGPNPLNNYKSEVEE